MPPLLLSIVTILNYIVKKYNYNDFMYNLSKFQKAYEITSQSVILTIEKNKSTEKRTLVRMISTRMVIV